MSTKLRRRRADATANLERVIQAAREVFAERGPDAMMDEIAARAGVGKATIYRSFPSKESLLAAILCDRLRWLTSVTREVAELADASQALSEFLTRAFEEHAANRAFTRSLSSVRHEPDVRAARAELDEALDVLLERGKRQGTIRADLTSCEVRVLLGGVGAFLAGEDAADLAVWRHFAELVASALRP
jgi:AcrR family transcriptional regulator